MNSIIYDEEIITPECDKQNYYNNFTERLDKRNCVKLALFCAKIVANNNKKNNLCIELVEKWLKDENSVSKQKLWDAAYSAWYTANISVNDNASAAVYYAAATSNAASDTIASISAYTVYYAVNANIAVTTKINKYLQILLRKTKQFQNNKILEQISKTDVDKLELVDWNMIIDIMQEEYNVIHEFDYGDIFSRRCLIELLRREYA